jgi:hypothetical protein
MTPEGGELHAVAPFVEKLNVTVDGHVLGLSALYSQ